MLSSRCKLIFYILVDVILINTLLTTAFGLQNFPTKQDPRHRRRVNIHVHVVTHRSDLLLDDNAEDEMSDRIFGEESAFVGKSDDIGDQYEVDDSYLDDVAGASNISDLCKECLRKKIENLEYRLMPGYPCDRWDPESRTCWLERGVGSTATLTLTFRNAQHKSRYPSVTWQQEFHMVRGEEREFFVINPDNRLWNTAISGRGHEFRISPISEMDIEPNRFSAFLSDTSTPIAKVHFKIRNIPIDLGFVYPGETFLVNIDTYSSLPIESIAYQWYMEGGPEAGTLPSNMKSSASGSMLTISELRRDQNGNLSCIAFTNRGFMIARRRFFIRSSAKEKAFKLSIGSKKSKGTTSTRKNTRFDELENAKSFSIKRRNALTIAEQQLEAALTALKHHNAQQDSNNFKSSIRRNSPQHQPGLSFRSQMNTRNQGHNQQKQLSNAVAGTRVDLARPMQTFGQNQRFFNQKNFPQASNERRNFFNAFTNIQPTRNFNMDSQSMTNSRLNFDSNHPDDQISMLIAECQRNTQCSAHAKCIIQTNNKGFCRCTPNYRGNGISCWEYSSELAP